VRVMGRYGKYLHIKWGGCTGNIAKSVRL